METFVKQGRKAVVAMFFRTLRKGCIVTRITSMQRSGTVKRPSEFQE